MKFISLLSVVTTVVATASAGSSVNLRKPEYDPKSLSSSGSDDCPQKCYVKKYHGVVHDQKCLVRLVGCVDDPKLTVSRLIDIFAEADSFEATYNMDDSGSYKYVNLENVLLPEGMIINGHPVAMEENFQDYLKKALP
ncbi:hypothetical protein PPTG_12944 [Phytophthora nicotianae INRA-310]|uniref:Uncharacterized protein n=3 Tax=Phytophthora nicotianae TaxID=4792 RepID=W2Q3Y0_PHYN3|nr:hypothetical protein PPTG_12944 [Phytophthora nicotianae INRA-310]ETI43318.1 hypothetical protein F443_11746 [Phytophthora nicotianae P1569]ETM43188.1 hypothetical protein L914_11280 [Phytophthora nicotianae]ETN06970.1 hypothetical protein PPTG_12944 [Phytophthora nicotianae INRA-310]KUF94286.1 hypothetical protein AM587_10014285 [Phytophthora nicotianae]